VVLGEESDVDPDGVPASHFDLYLAAMDEVGAPTDVARAFIDALRAGVEVDAALTMLEAPVAARAFVAHTLNTVKRASTIEVLSSCLFGREDLIPEMFARLLPQWSESRAARGFAYYVERHIELDGDEHGPAGERALVDLAGQDAAAWQAAARAAEGAIRARIELWNGVYAGLVMV
jgi:hypothetical protein